MKPILPGATLGVLGGGQLGRMFTMSARRLGYRVHVLSPEDDTPTGQVADLEINAAYDDENALRRFAADVDVVTFEFENVPAVAAKITGEFVPVRPAGDILAIAQNRLREKNWLHSNGFPTPNFATIASESDLIAALKTVGTPAVLKSAAWGYDGKSQRRVNSPADAIDAWQACGAGECICESLVDFDCELSVIAARGIDRDTRLYGPLRNHHENHILDVTRVPAGIPKAVENDALDLARNIVDALDLVGVLCVEMFLARDGSLLVNELAPRPHNSGHLTIDACVTCQFEQQVRAVCGLPLGSAELIRPAACANLLGDLWQHGAPRWQNLLKMDDVKLHLYGKRAARPGRKMGHITALANTPEAAERRVRDARATTQWHD